MRVFSVFNQYVLSLNMRDHKSKASKVPKLLNGLSVQRLLSYCSNLEFSSMQQMSIIITLWRNNFIAFFRCFFFVFPKTYSQNLGIISGMMMTLSYSVSQQVLDFFYLEVQNNFGAKIQFFFFFENETLLVIFKTPCSKAKGQGINAFLKSHKSILALFFAKETFFVEKGKSTSHSSYLLTVKRINSC